jgi:hypothetical protein
VAVYRENYHVKMKFCFKNTVANGDSKFGIKTGNLSNRKNVPQKMWRYSEYGDESSGDNSRVNCIINTSPW